MTAELPPSRTLTLPQQRALEALAEADGRWVTQLYMFTRGHQSEALEVPIMLGMVAVDMFTGEAAITDKGRRYLALLGR